MRREKKKKPPFIESEEREKECGALGKALGVQTHKESVVEISLSAMCRPHEGT